MEPVCRVCKEIFMARISDSTQEPLMSLSTALIVNLALDVTVLGALAHLCRAPFRLSDRSALVRMPSRALPAERDERAAQAPAEAFQIGGAAAAAMNRSAR
jgi:hypothetical protein